MEKHDEEKALRLNCQVHRRASIRSSAASSPRSATPETCLMSPIESTEPPETIILGLWPHATGEQIQYYIQGYESLYPSAQLHLLRYSGSYDRQVGNVLDAITAAPERQWSYSPNVLLHLFGDHGAAQGCRLLRTYKLRTGRALNVKAVVMDSVPEPIMPSLQLSMRTPQRMFTYIVAMLTMVYYWILSTLTFWHAERRARQTQRDLKDPFLLPTEARKCYIFAAKDLMFTWCDSPVERLDEKLERQEYTVKRSSIDDKGKWTGDQERYWMGIENAWEGR